MQHWLDYLIFVAVLVASVAIGLYHAFSGGKQRTNEEFIMANRKLKVLPTAISITVSYMSALMIVGGPAEMYSQGFMAWPGFRIGAGLSLFVIVFVIVPWIYPLRLTSVYSYFRLRYGNGAIQIYAAVIGIISSTLYTGAAIYAPSISLESATGFPAMLSIPIMAVVCIIYTTLGGMRAVIWTDVFQAVIMLGGLLAILIKTSMLVGNAEDVFDIIKDEGRLKFNLSPDPTVRHTLWAFLFGAPVGDMLLSGLTQSSVQRYSAIVTLKQAQMLPILWYFGAAIISSLSFLTGLYLVAYYSSIECDPLESKQIQNINQLVPNFIRHSFSYVPGFSGLFTATMYSATLSTVSSNLSGASANAWADLVQPAYPNLSEKKATLISKTLVVILGFIGTGFAFLVSKFQGPLLAVAMALVTSCNAPIGGMFLLGGIKLFRKIHWTSVLSGGVCGFAANMWLTLGAAFAKTKLPSLPPVSTEGCTTYLNITDGFINNSTNGLNTPTVLINGSSVITGLDRFYSLSYLYYPVFGVLITVLVALIVELSSVWLCEKDFYIPDKSTFISLRHKSRMARKGNVQMNGGTYEMVPLKEKS